MNSFLYRIAQTYYAQKQSDISNFTFVFPNRRAGLFFQRYIAEVAKKPVFSPVLPNWSWEVRTTRIFMLFTFGLNGLVDVFS